MYVQVFCTAKNLNCRDSQGYGIKFQYAMFLFHINEVCCTAKKPNAIVHQAFVLGVVCSIKQTIQQSPA